MLEQSQNQNCQDSGLILRRDASTDDPMVGRVINDYEILAKIGEGGMGVVYKARDRRLRRMVALKRLPADRADDPRRRRRFLREARATSVLQHPGIVTLFGLVTDENVDLIAMEYVEGRSLRRRIPAHGLEWPVAVRY